MSIEAFRPENSTEELLDAMAECSRGMAEQAQVMHEADMLHKQHLERRIQLSEVLWRRVLDECSGNVEWARWRMRSLQVDYYAGTVVAGEESPANHLHAVEN